MARTACTDEGHVHDEDRDAAQTVHTITVADLADEFTRHGLVAAASSCGR